MRAEWLAEQDLLVIELFDAGLTRHIFVSGWRRGCRWVVAAQGQLQVMPVHADPGLPLLDADVDWARLWRETIPSDVRSTLAPFVLGRWALLYWASHYSAALDLLRSEPKLLWLLLMTGEREGWSEHKIACHLRLKRRTLLKLCGLQGTEAALKLLGNCRLSSYGREALGDVRAILVDAETIHSLRHVPSLGPATLRFILKFPVLRGARWVREAPHQPDYFPELNKLLGDIHLLGQQLNKEHVEEQIFRCGALAELRRLHDRWVDQLNRQRRRASPSVSPHPRGLTAWVYRSYGRLSNAIMHTIRHGSRCLSRYPAPPCAGTRAIRPIKSYRALFREGRTQRHCVAAYHQRILDGHYYVYQVLEPERCTLGLALTHGQPPRLDQLKGFRNQVVSDETRRLVETWLNRGRQPMGMKQPRAQPTRAPIPETFQPAPIRAPEGERLDESDLVMLIVCPDHVDDIQQALQVTRQDTFQASLLRLAVIPDAFAFEGPEKQHLGHLARALIEPRVDALIRIDSHQVAEALGDEWSPAAAKARVQETLTEVVRSITDTITKPGLIGVDLTDVRAIFGHRGKAVAAVGVSTGPEPGRAWRAAEQAHRSLALSCRFNNALAVLACITGGMDLSINEFDEVGNVLRENLPEEAIVVLSIVIEPDLPPGQIQVCIIAAGVETY